MYRRIPLGEPVPTFVPITGFALGQGLSAPSPAGPPKPFSLFDLNPFTRRLPQQQRAAAAGLAGQAAAGGVEQQQAPEHAADGGVNQQEAGPADEEQEDKGSRKRKRAGSLAEPPAVKPAAAAAHEDDTDHEDEPAVGSDGEHSSHSHSYSSIRGHSSSGSEGSELDSDQEAGSDGDVLGTLDGDMEDEAAAAAAAAGDAMEALRDVIEGDSESEGFIPLGSALAADEVDAAALQQQQKQNAKSGAAFMPPWVPGMPRFVSPSLRLHQEVVAFTQILEPTPQEADARRTAVDAVRGLVQGIWKDADVKPFGSYATGLYTPASDIDLVLVNTRVNNPTIPLKALATALLQKQLIKPSSLQEILTARVPIIKFEMVESGLCFDVCCDQQGGLRAVEYVRQMLQQWPALKPLALVLKVYLSQREMNEVYTGGIGSFSLVNMIVTSLQLHASRRREEQQQRRPKKRAKHRQQQQQQQQGKEEEGEVAQEEVHLDGNLGVLLMDFFRLYGRQLQAAEVGITCADGGAFLSKDDLPASNQFYGRDGYGREGNGPMLYVQDPLDSSNDTARGSWNYFAVRKSFDHAYQLMCVPCEPRESLLGRIIHLQPVLEGREVPVWVRQAPIVLHGSGHQRGAVQRHQQQEGGRGGAGNQHRHHHHQHQHHHHDHHQHGSGRKDKGGRKHQQQQQQQQQEVSPYERHRDKRRKVGTPAATKGRGGWHHEDGDEDDQQDHRHHHHHHKHQHKHHKHKKQQHKEHHHHQQQGGGGGGSSSKKQRRKSGGSERGSSKRRHSGGSGHGRHTHFNSD